MKYTAIAAGTAMLVLATPASAAPGLGSEVYGASVEAGELELESRFDTLTGGDEGGEDVIKLEAAYGVTDRLRIGVIGEFEQEPGFSREAEAIGIEAIHELAHVGGIDLAIYGEYEIGLNGHTDKVETKLLMQHKSGPLDLRFNLIAEKPLAKGEKVELAYAASADVAAFGEVRVGVQAFGDLGTFSRFLPHAEHFAGPAMKVEIEGLGPELELEAGYLFALGEARHETDGQLRIGLELEF